MKSLIAVALFVALPCTAQPSLHRCSIAAVESRCGTMNVDEARRPDTTRRIAFNVVVVPRESASSARGALFILGGGPGESITTSAPTLAETFAPVRRHYDLVFVDQRGTSPPHRLDCAVAPRTFVVPASREGCLSRLSQIADLTHYGSEDFIADLEETRAALGYDRVAIYGASYGTRAAYLYTRRYPQRVEALILVAAAPLSMSILDSLDKEHGDDPYLTMGIRFLKYSAESARTLPALLKDRAALEGAIDSFRASLLQRLALGLHLSVNCSEELPLASKDTVERREYARACEGWPRLASVPRADGSRINVRALVITGERDPVTPPVLGRAAAGQFTDGTLLIIPRAGHIAPEAAEWIARKSADFLVRK